VIGVVAVTAGIVLPQMLAGVAPLPEKPPAPPAEARADPFAYTPPAWPEPPSPRGMLLRLVGGTAAVLVLCVGTLWACRRWLRRLPGQDNPAGRLSLVETLPLGNRCSVHLVRVGRQQVVVGVDGSGLKSLVALPELFDEALAEAGGPAERKEPAPW
jgi:flagellar biogenesis protein FliO